jgi:hypothetical protein
LSAVEDLSRAVEIATGLIEQSSKTAHERELKLYYLHALQTAGSSMVDRLPPDLFYPSGGKQHDMRTLGLPDGQQGEIELSRNSQLAPGKGWLTHSVRKIVTRVAGTSQESREIWDMQPKPTAD